MRNCTCPVGTYLTSITALTCPTSLGQVQKLIFQRTVSTAGAIADLPTRTTWTTLQSAVNDTKIVITPYISAFTTEVGAAREFGTGNEVRNGIPIIFGSNPTKVTLRLYEPNATVVSNIKALECETISVYLINELGYIAHSLSSDGTLGQGFAIQSFRVSDRMLGGFDGPDYVEISFSLASNWSEDFTILAPTTWSALDL